MTQPYNDDLTVLVQCLATTFGDEVGQAVNEKINNLIALEGVDVAALQAQITALNNALAANTAGDGLTAQSILASLAAIEGRVGALESDPRLATLITQVAGLSTALAAETQSRVDADAGLQSSINAIQSEVDQLSQSLVSLQAQVDAGGSSACDCAAITAAIASQATAIANLQASDAAQSAQIAALQTAVEALEVSAAGIAGAVAAAAAAQAAAAAASQAAANAAAAAAAAQADVNALEGVVAGLEAGQAVTNNTFVTKLEIQNINCAVMGGHFRHAMRSRMNLAD